MEGRFVRHSRRVAYENAWITVWHDEVSRPDGSPGIYGVVHFENLAAGVLAFDDEDRIVLVGQHRYTLDRGSWEIPEGGVPPTETPLQGIQRELREETGLEATDWREIGRLDLSNIDDLINERTKVVSLTWVSNMLGTINPVADLVAGDAGADGRDGAGDLVAGDHGEDRPAPLLADLVDVAVADAGEGDVDQDVVVPERSVLDGTGLEGRAG